MTELTSVSNELTKLKSAYANDDIDLVKFMHDHYQEIFDTSEVVVLDKEDHYWKYYRLEDFLAERYYDPNVAWIVLMINQMSSNADFKELETIRLPDQRTLDALRRTFLQYRSSIKSCRK